MILIGHTHSSQFMKWKNLVITIRKYATCAPNIFEKLSENQITTDFIYLTFSNFVTISHINYWDQVNSWKNLWKFWNGSLCRNKSDPFPLPNVVAYWKSITTEACAKKLYQILANNIDNGGRGIGLKIYVRYCSFFCHSNLRWETGGFELASTITLVFKIPLLVIYYLTKFDDVTQSGFWVNSKNYIFKFRQANLWYHKLFHLHLPFWIWKVWKGREKITKIWISWEQKELFRWNKKLFS